MRLRQAAACILVGAALMSGCASQPPARQPENAGKQRAGVVAPAAPAPAETLARAADEKMADSRNDEFNVYFALGSSDLLPAEREKILRHAERLKEHAKAYVTLVGHTDDSGSRSYNLAMMDMRVSAVRQQLKAFGVALRQIRRNVSGRDRSSRCKSLVCQQQAQRVELVYSSPDIR